MIWDIKNNTALLFHLSPLLDKYCIISNHYTSAHMQAVRLTVIIPISPSNTNTLDQSHPGRAPLSAAECHASPGSSLCRFPNCSGKDRLLLNAFSSCFGSLPANSLSFPSLPQFHLKLSRSFAYSKVPVRPSACRQFHQKGISRIGLISVRLSWTHVGQWEQLEQD